MINKPTRNDLVFTIMSDFKPWTFWDLQQTISEKYGEFYGEPSISAAIRDIRKPEARKKYNLPPTGEVVVKEKRPAGKGYQYRLAPTIIQYNQGRK